jgi:hypothetical protein
MLLWIYANFFSDFNAAIFFMKTSQQTHLLLGESGNTKEGRKYHCTIDLLFDWFGLVCFANKNKNGQLSNSWFQTSQTGGQWCSDTSPLSIPWVSIPWVASLKISRER